MGGQHGSGRRGVRFQLASDLHIEAGGKPFSELVRPVPGVDILALCGDICSPLLPSYFEFIEYCSRRFKHVLVISGNHEYFNVPALDLTRDTPPSDQDMPVLTHLTMAQMDDKIQGICGKFPNVTYLNNQTIVIDGVQFIGSTLWSWIPPQLRNRLDGYMTEYKLALAEAGKRLTADHTSRLFLRNLKFIEDAVNHGSQQGWRNVVLTHHPPSMRGTSSAAFEGQDTTHGFSSDLDKALESRALAAWCAGHTHHNFQQVRGAGCKLVSNQHGHRKPLQDYKPDFVVEV